MIHFKTLEIEGFASIVKPLSYDLSSTGINLIVGNNGSGKSTIFNALSWAIYGKLLKTGSELETWDAYKTIEGYRGTKVSVSIKIGLEEVTIIRCKDFKGELEGKKGGSAVYLYINGILYTKHKNKLDINNKIQSIMGVSFELFKNSLAFGQNLTRLLREKGPHQKELFDEAFNIHFINRARDLAKSKWDELKEVLNSHTHAIEVLDAKIQGVQNSIDNEIAIKKRLDQEKAAKIKALKVQRMAIKKAIAFCNRDKVEHSKLQAEIKTMESELKGISKTLSGQAKVSNEHFQKDFALTQKDGELQDVKRRMEEIIQILSSPKPTCHTCGQPINKEKQEARAKQFRKEMGELRVKKVALLNEYALLKLAVTKLSSELKEYESIKSMITPKQRILEDKYSKLEALGYYPEKLKDKKIELRNIRNQIRDTVKNSVRLNTESKVVERAKLEQERASELELRTKVEKHAKLHDWLVTDALSNKGLKAYVFFSMISQINKRLRYYAKTGWRIEFIMDLDSGYKNFKAVIYDQNDVRPYEDLSGGEQQIVDICLAFSMHDVIAEERFNILLMDEVFESLDKSNIEVVTELIYRKARKVSIHLVTHRTEFVTSSVKAIYLKKTRSGGTSIVR